MGTYLLPPANEVWGKVLFLHLFVCQGGLCMTSLPVWLPGPMFLLGSLCLWYHVPSGGLCQGDRGLCPGNFCPGVSLSIRISLGGGALSRGSVSGRICCTVKSVQYTSYWNAFLFLTLLEYVVMHSLKF